MVPRARRFLGHCVASLVLTTSIGLPALAQNAAPDAVVQKIQAANTTVELTVNSSRILTMDGTIPKAQVANPELLDFTVLSQNEVQLHAKKAGITTVNLWDDKGEIHTVDVIIGGDVRELELLLRSQFPSAAIKLDTTSASTLIMSGYVDRADNVNRIVRIAEDYFPKVLNNMIVGGSQQVLLHVKVMEVSRSSLKQLGFDWMNFSAGGDFVGSTASGIITKGNPVASVFRTAGVMTTSGGETFQFGVVSNPEGFVGFVDALKQNDLLKVLAEPNLVTVSGRPASYLVGGQMPYPMPTGFGNIAVNFRDFGTQIDFVPIVLGNGGVRLEVRPRVSEIDPTLGVSIAGTIVPGFRLREVDTGVELKFGQTLAIAGLLQQRTTMVKRGIPYLMDIPFIGAAFCRKSNRINEVELLIMVRPELVEGLDPEQVPPCGPGMTSMSPDDCGMYWKGYMEVPVKMPNNGPAAVGPGAHGPMEGMSPEQIMPGDQLRPGDQLVPDPEPADAPGPSARKPASGRADNVAASPKPRTEAVPRVSQASSRRTVQASAQSNSYNPSTPQKPKSTAAPKAQSNEPGFIGPRGYDVRK
ncbi:MAG: pilus assembly protein N-terminal domain-containing protein [Pirellulales bacterium]